jgi:hypothetical protein
MPSWTEFRLAIQGLLRLARFNPDFPRFFDRSARGALRSFWLIAPIYPLYLLQLWNSPLIERAADTAQFFLAMSIGYVNQWLVPPVLIAWLAPIAGRNAEMPGCITIYNWSNVLSVGATLPLMTLDLAGVPEQIMAVPYNILLLVLLVWEAFLLTHTLRIAIWQAVLATVADYLITHWILLSIFLAMAGVS